MIRVNKKDQWSGVVRCHEERDRWGGQVDPAVAQIVLDQRAWDHFLMGGESTERSGRVFKPLLGETHRPNMVDGWVQINCWCDVLIQLTAPSNQTKPFFSVAEISFQSPPILPRISSYDRISSTHHWFHHSIRTLGTVGNFIIRPPVLHHWTPIFHSIPPGLV